ncbi:MAG TPA: hypothetical protein VII90_07150, partial [Anaerolineales bacterium]
MVNRLRALKIFRALFFCVIAFASACNLHLKTAFPPIGGPTPEAATEKASSAINPGAGFQVEILSPLNGAEVPAGSPLTVTARCSGGEAIEAILNVDSQTVANLPTSIPPGQA